MEKRTLIIIFATLLLFAVGGLGGYLIVISTGQEKESELPQITQSAVQSKGATVQSDEITSRPKRPSALESINTSGWKIYTNQRYGYELRHPKEWQCVIERYSGKEVYFDVQCNDTPGELFGRDWVELLDDVVIKYYLSISSLTGAPNLSIEEWIMAQEFFELQEEISVGLHQGYLVLNHGEIGTPGKTSYWTLFLPYPNGGVLSISIAAGHPQLKDFLPLIGSIRFLNEETTE